MIRSALGDSQTSFAQRIGKSPGTISNWEREEVEPEDGTDLLLADRAGVSLRWLRTGEGEMFTAYDTGLSPLGATMQTTTPTHHSHTTSTTGGDMIYDPSWVVPMLLSAHIAIMHSSDLEKARRMKEAGRRFAVRLVVEEQDNDKEPPSQKKP